VPPRISICNSNTAFTRDLDIPNRLLLRFWTRRNERIVVPFPPRGFSLLERVQTGTGAHTTYSLEPIAVSLRGNLE
jgi:hypothetical protein